MIYFCGNPQLIRRVECNSLIYKEKIAAEPSADHPQRGKRAIPSVGPAENLYKPPLKGVYSSAAVMDQHKLERKYEKSLFDIA